jgi:DNA topoisomerase IB
VRDAAAANYVMSISGLRVGSTDAKLGAVKTYGISNLRTYHVQLDTVDNTKVNFDFVGKKGTVVDKTVYSKPLADYLDAKTYGDRKDKIFSATSYAGISNYMSSLQGANGFTPKDYRTWHGTTTALATIKDYNSKYEPPATLKEFKTYQKEVGMTVAKQLGHKNAAKESATAVKYYIDPVVWTPWQMGIKK